MVVAMPPTTTMMARAIMEVLAVTATRSGWRVRLPWATKPVPSRASRRENRAPKPRVIGRTNAGAMKTSPKMKINAPGVARAGWPLNKAAKDKAIKMRPVMAPAPNILRANLPLVEGRSASSGVTRPALKAGSSPASSVTPMPKAEESSTMGRVTTGF